MFLIHQVRLLSLIYVQSLYTAPLTSISILKAVVVGSGQCFTGGRVSPAVEENPDIWTQQRPQSCPKNCEAEWTGPPGKHRLYWSTRRSTQPHTDAQISFPLSQSWVSANKLQHCGHGRGFTKKAFERQLLCGGVVLNAVQIITCKCQCNTLWAV